MCERPSVALQPESVAVVLLSVALLPAAASAAATTAEPAGPGTDLPQAQLIIHARTHAHTEQSQNNSWSFYSNPNAIHSPETCILITNLALFLVFF